MLYMLGGAGVQNFGDEMMVRNWLDFYKESGLLSDVVVDGADAVFLREFFSEKYSDATFVSIFNGLKELGENDFWKSLRRGLRFYENGGLNNYSQHRQWVKKIQNVKVMHLHGGGYLNTLWPKSAFLLGVAAATKYKFGCRLVATGIGLQPLSDPPDEFLSDFSKVISAFDVFESRDWYSNNFIQRTVNAPGNYFFGLDDTFLNSVDIEDSGVRRRGLHISYFPFGSPTFDKLIDDLPDNFFEKFEKIYFWNCAREDGACLDILKRSQKNIQVISLHDLIFRPLPLKVDDFMITSRFHPHMFAARAGAQGFCRFGSSGGGYYDVKQGSIVELGSSFKSLSSDLSKFEQNKPIVFNRMLAFDLERVGMKRKLAKRIVDMYNSH